MMENGAKSRGFGRLALDIGHGVILILDGLTQRGVLDRLAEGHDGGAVGVADLGGGNAVNRFQESDARPSFSDKSLI